MENQSLVKYKIVLVSFPFDDLSGQKVRPAVCLTDVISGYNHIVIAFITSQLSKATQISDLIIKHTDSNFSQTGLKVDSAIRFHRLVTIPAKLIKRILGELPSDYHNQLEVKLRNLFEL